MEGEEGGPVDGGDTCVSTTTTKIGRASPTITVLTRPYPMAHCTAHLIYCQVSNREILSVSHQLLALNS